MSDATGRLCCFCGFEQEQISPGEGDGTIGWYEMRRLPAAEEDAVFMCPQCAMSGIRYFAGGGMNIPDADLAFDPAAIRFCQSMDLQQKAQFQKQCKRHSELFSSRFLRETGVRRERLA